MLLCCLRESILLQPRKKNTEVREIENKKIKKMKLKNSAAFPPMTILSNKLFPSYTDVAVMCDISLVLMQFIQAQINKVGIKVHKAL